MGNYKSLCFCESPTIPRTWPLNRIWIAILHSNIQLNILDHCPGIESRMFPLVRDFICLLNLFFPQWRLSRFFFFYFIFAIHRSNFLLSRMTPSNRYTSILLPEYHQETPGDRPKTHHFDQLPIRTPTTLTLLNVSTPHTSISFILCPTGSFTPLTENMCLPCDLLLLKGKQLQCIYIKPPWEWLS